MTSSNLTPEALEAAATAGALARRGVTAKVNDTDREVAAAVVSAFLQAVGETTTDWGVRFAPGDFLSVRWCPTRGGTRPDLPYTEDEARADSNSSGCPVVKRTRTEYALEDDRTGWVSA